MTTPTDRIRGLREKIDLARKVESGCDHKGLAANLRLYIAELEIEIQQLQAEITRGGTPNEPSKDDAQ